MNKARVLIILISLLPVIASAQLGPQPVSPYAPELPEHVQRENERRMQRQQELDRQLQQLELERRLRELESDRQRQRRYR